MDEDTKVYAYAEVTVSPVNETISKETKSLLDEIEAVSATVTEHSASLEEFAPKASRINVRSDGNLELSSVDESSKLLLTSEGMEINLNREQEGKSYSRFTSKSVIFGNYEIKRTNFDGGLTFSLVGEG